MLQKSKGVWSSADHDGRGGADAAAARGASADGCASPRPRSPTGAYFLSVDVSDNESFQAFVKVKSMCLDGGVCVIWDAAGAFPPFTLTRVRALLPGWISPLCGAAAAWPVPPRKQPDHAPDGPSR